MMTWGPKIFSHPLWSDLLQDLGPTEQTTCLAYREPLLVCIFFIEPAISFGDPEIVISPPTLRGISLGTFPLHNKVHYSMASEEQEVEQSLRLEIYF